MNNSMANLLLAGGLAALSVLMQGCDVSIPHHDVGNWRKEASYLLTYSFTPPGKGGQLALNSCANPAVPTSLKCSGHGICADWFETAAGGTTASELSFCQCDSSWADPECSTPRKSQATAFLLSIFLGVFGVDQFYLGYVWPQGILKLLTLGGAGVWWIYDVVRVGSSPIFASDDYRVSADVSHWAYVLTVITLMGVIGFGLSIWSINRHRVLKAREIMLLQAEVADPDNQPMYKSSGPVSFRGYGTTMQSGAPRV